MPVKVHVYGNVGLLLLLLLLVYATTTHPIFTRRDGAMQAAEEHTNMAVTLGHAHYPKKSIIYRSWGNTVHFI